MKSKKEKRKQWPYKPGSVL